jgi:hypothetical protein
MRHNVKNDLKNMLTNKTYFGIIVKVGVRRWQTKCESQGLQTKHNEPDRFTNVKPTGKMVLEN